MCACLGKVYQEELLMKCLTEQMKAKCLKDLTIRLRKVREAANPDKSDSQSQRPAETGEEDSEVRQTS